MGLRFVYGRAGSGKSHLCLQEIKEAVSGGSRGPLILVVPEQYTLQAEKNLVRAIGSTGIIGAEVMSFRRMAHRVFNEVGGLTRKTINSAGKAMLLCSIIDDMKDDLNVFSKAAGQQGFIGVVVQTISEFKRYGVTPARLKELAGSAAPGGLLKQKLKELAGIYGAFEEALEGRYVDNDDHLTLLAEKLGQSSRFDDAEVWLDGFSGFTPQEYRIIGELLGKARRVSVCLCTDSIELGPGDSIGVFSPVGNAVSRLKAIAKERGVGLEPPVFLSEEPPYRFKDSTGLSHLEREYFRFPCRAYGEKTGDISIFAATNVYSEVEYTAADILRLCRDEGFRYRDIAVAVRDPGSYGKLIGSIFDEYGIPCFIDGKKDILGNPMVQYILSALDILIHNWSYQVVFRYLKTGLAGIAYGDIDMLENYVLACGIRGAAWTREGEWTMGMGVPFDDRRMPDYEKEMLERVNETRHRVVEPLTGLRSRMKGRKRVRDLCTALYEFLCDVGVPERIEERINRLDSAGELNLANEYRQIWGILVEALDQMVEAMGDRVTGIEGFRRMLEAGLSEYRVGLIPPALDQVLVADPERSRSHDIKALYILGVNDGVFPALCSDEGILCDKDRQDLNAMGIELAQDTRTKALEEQYLLYRVLTTPSKYLRLSYAIADHRGRSMRPSVIISRVKKLFPGITEHSNVIDRGMDSPDLVTAPLPTFNRLISAVRKNGESLRAAGIWQEVHRWYMENPGWADRYRAVLSGLDYSNQAGSIGKEKAGRLYGSPLYTSISRLERFASCPFAYFMQYGLRAKERRQFGFTAPDMGTFLHGVIDRFSRNLSQKGMTWRSVDREWCAREVADIVDEILNSEPAAILGNSPRYRYLTARLKRMLTRAVWMIARHIQMGGFEPLGYEMAFGGEGDFPPIVLDLPSGERVYLTGRIDRVDALETGDGTYIRVIDYKSGSKDFSLSDLYHGLQIQLITYLAALLENGTGKLKGPILPAGILYFKVDDPIIADGRGMTDEEIERAVMKKLRMDGLVLEDIRVIREMDKDLEGSSLIIPARINKGDVLGKSSAASAEQFELLKRHVRGLLTRTAGEMLEGNVSIAPYRKDRFTPCSYCEYSPICQFDTAFADNRYRILREIKDEQVWSLVGNSKEAEKGEVE
jgi:ATP-dependent helicase/nuclease subunit B